MDARFLLVDDGPIPRENDDVRRFLSLPVTAALFTLAPATFAQVQIAIDPLPACRP